MGIKYRWWTLLYRVNRVASNDVTIKGIPIKKGTVIGISIIGRHMDPEIWPEPEKYDPERWVGICLNLEAVET